MFKTILIALLMAGTCFSQTSGIVITSSTITGMSGSNTPTAVKIQTLTLPNGQQGTQYTQTVNATGGIPPYAFSVTAGALPNSIVLNPLTGVLTGIPSAQGTFNFTIQVCDAQLVPSCDSRPYTVTISAGGGTITTDFTQFFGWHQHNPPGVNNSVPITLPANLVRVWGTGCQWNCVEFGTAADPVHINFNWSSWDSFISNAAAVGAKVMITLGQIPTFISAHDDITTGQRPYEFSIQSASCNGSTCTVLTNFRNYYASGNSVTISGSSCSDLNASWMLTGVGSNTNLPATMSASFNHAVTETCTGGTIIDSTLTASGTVCNGTGNNGTPLQGLKGTCYPLLQVAQDGSGDDRYLIDATSTNCTVTVNGVLQAGGQPCGFLYWFNKHYSASGDNADPNHVIQSFEPPCGNEPQGKTFCEASYSQLATMAKDTYTFIKGSARSDIQIGTPAPSGGINGPSGFFAGYAALSSNPFQYADFIGWHGYSWTQTGIPNPEDIISLTGNVNTVLATVPAAAGKLTIDTEINPWGSSNFAVGCDQPGANQTTCGPQGPNSTVIGAASTPNHAGIEAEHLLLHACQGYSRQNFFAWDGGQGTGAVNTAVTPQTLEPTGTAIGVIRDWLGGATISTTCTKNTTTKTWTLGISRSGGFAGLVVWNQTLATVGSFTVTAGQYIGWYDISGGFHAIGPTVTTVPVLYDPIMLVTKLPPLTISTDLLPPGNSGTPYSQSVISLGGTAPFSWTEVSVPTGFPSGISMNSNGLVSGNTLSTGLFTSQVRVTDANKLTFAKTITLSISTGAPLTVTNGPCGSGSVNALYVCSLTASGGALPYTWTLVSGTNPAGTTLNPAGVVSGNPTTAATYTPTYKVTDSTSPTPQTKLAGPYSIVIIPQLSTCGPPGFLCSSRSTATVQVPSPPPFNASSPVNTIAYDTSLNPVGLNPILRATDPTTSTSSCTVTPSGSASDNLWATDHSKVALTCGNGNFVLFFDGVNMQITGRSLNIPNSGGGMEFSRVDPNILYTLQQANGGSGHAGAIWKVTFTGGTAFTQTLFFDPITAPGAGCATLVGKTYTSTILSGDSADANFETVAVTSGQQSVGWVAHYDIANNNCEVLDTNTGIVTLENGTTGAASGDATLCWPIGVHAGRIFKNGLAGGFATAAIGACINAPHLWTYGTRTVRRCNSSVSPFTCGPNHDYDGYNVRVISPTVTGQGGTAQLYFYTETGTLPPPLGQYYGTIPSQDDEHFTSFGPGANLDLNPLVGETVKLTWDGSPFVPPFYGEDEIFAMPRTPLAGAPFIRFAHHFASSVVQCPTCDFRTLNAIGSTSQDGKFLIFVSDMRLGLGTATCGASTCPRQDLFIIGLDYTVANGQQSSVTALQANNTPTCTGNGSPDAGCTSAFVALSTDPANTNAQTQVIGPTPGNMSTLTTKSLLYSGATSKVRAYYQPFFPCGSHINIGMDERVQATIAKQAAAMVAAGVDIVNIDYYGSDVTLACEKSIADAWVTYLTANPSVPLKLEIMLDQGALKPACPVNVNDQTACLKTAMEAQIDTIDSTYGTNSFYSLDASSRPFLFYFITPTTWHDCGHNAPPCTDFTSGTGIYATLLTYVHTHYSNVYQVVDRFGSFSSLADGEYAWIQPPLYVNASPASQKCWDDIAGGTCNWVTGVGSGTSYLNTFYTACRANPTKHCIGMLSKGFDWTHASWLTAPKIVQQGCGNVPQLMAAKVAANGYSSASQLEGIGWVTWNDYEEETAMEMGIDNCARPTVSLSAPNQLGWLENPTDVTYFSESGTIDHWEIWYTTTGGAALTKALGGIAPSVSTEVISSVIPSGTWDVYLYMVGKSGIMNRLAGPVSYTH